jgi:sucrose-6-phosphate hydrolase SacC (GH32 family)
LPVAIGAPYPNNADDMSGRWTGNATKDPASNNLRVLFTEWTDQSFHPQTVEETVWTSASQDGVNFSLYKGKPVISQPPPNSDSGFRDPKIFWDPIEKT